MTDLSADQIRRSHETRECEFISDDSSQELGRVNQDGTEINRQGIHYRELGPYKVAASLDRVQYGNWKGEKACLMSLSLQFYSGTHKLFRFTSVNVEVELRSRTSTNAKDDPIIQNCGPKSLKAVGTDSQESPYWSAQLSFKATLPFCEIGPQIARGSTSTFVRHYAQEVGTILMPNQRNPRPCTMKLWAIEDQEQEHGVPIEMLTSLVFTYSSHSKAMVKISANLVFNLLARPWTRDDPILLDESQSRGEPIRPQQTNVDFATLTDDEWRELVTPDLVIRNALHGK